LTNTLLPPFYNNSTLRFKSFRVCYRVNVLYNYTALVTNIIILVAFTMVTLVAKFIGVSIDTMSNMITNFTNVYMVHALIKDAISRQKFHYSNSNSSYIFRLHKTTIVRPYETKNVEKIKSYS
jgi:hypothetical protein